MKKGKQVYNTKYYNLDMIISIGLDFLFNSAMNLDKFILRNGEVL